MRCLYISAVLEQDKEREMAGETQPNGDLNEDQTQMTPFEMNLKDKRFVAAAAASALRNSLWNVWIIYLNFYPGTMTTSGH